MASPPTPGDPSVDALRRLKEAEAALEARLKEAREQAEKEKAQAREQCAEELKRAREAAGSAELAMLEAARREARAEAARILSEAEAQARAMGTMTAEELDDRFPEGVTALFGDLRPSSAVERSRSR